MIEVAILNSNRIRLAECNTRMFTSNLIQNKYVQHAKTLSKKRSVLCENYETCYWDEDDFYSGTTSIPRKRRSSIILRCTLKSFFEVKIFSQCLPEDKYAE